MTEGAIIDAAFRTSGVAQGDFSYSAKPGPPTPLRSFLSSDTVLTVAVDPQGRRLNRVETLCRQWAAEHGIRVPEVLDADDEGAWLLARRVHKRPLEGRAYVQDALDVADRLAALPAPQLDIPASQWRGSRRSLPARILRTSVGGINPVEFVRAREAAAGLSDRVNCHGDYYRRNVLASVDGDVSIVDWEFVGTAPRWTDHVRFWSTLRRPEDRAVAWDRMTEGSAPSEHLLVLTRWMTLRLLAENLAAPRSQRNPADLAHARVVVSEVRGLRGRSR